jgi:hypothetical protein
MGAPQRPEGATVGDRKSPDTSRSSRSALLDSMGTGVLAGI